jgi:glycerol-3-phosphate dehydrogenase
MSPNAPLAESNRGPLLDSLEQTSFDVVIIGGGITGAGAAREATLRGLRVAVIEAHDFASGTSSRSSKLIHGGLRYLAMGDVSLVRETALERKRLHQLAPHLAEPRWMLAPARSRAGLLKFRTAITLYEKLGAVTQKDRHHNWQGEELRTNEPSLNHDEYPYACAYREYLTDDVRLVLANLRDATREGAVAANHLKVTEIIHESERAAGVVAQCALSGRSVRIKASAVINAAGPWIEGLMALDEGAKPSRLHLSKGIHIVVDRKRLPVRNLVIMSTEDRRTIFAIARGDSVYVGTTDTTYAGSATVWPDIERHDVEYLLAPLQNMFNVEHLGPDDVTAAWSGLRPLVAQAGKEAKQISRRDEIWVSPQRLVTIAGGKLTGYRRMAEDVINRVVEAAPTLASKCQPANQDVETPLPGGDFAGDLNTLANEVSATSGADNAHAQRLVRLYGCEAHAVAQLGSTPVVEGGTVVTGEIRWAVEQEAAATLEDVIYRRTRAALYESRECEALLEPVSRELQTRLEWTDEHRTGQVALVRARLQHDLAFKSEAGASS